MNQICAHVRGNVATNHNCSVLSTLVMPMTFASRALFPSAKIATSLVRVTYEQIKHCLSTGKISRLG